MQVQAILRKLAGASSLLVLLLIVAAVCPAATILTTLGPAGPQNWAVLVGPNTTDFQLNGPGTTNGNVGYDGTSTVQLNSSNSPAIAINGNLVLNTSDVNNTAQVSGSVTANASALSTDWNDAVVASGLFAAMTATQSLGSAINGTTTINSSAAGATNVVDFSTINLGNGQTLTLNGDANSQFIINVSTSLVLNSGRILLTGGLTTSDVVINVTASGNAISTSGGLNNESIINGILLAPTSGIAFAPGQINGELIAGGQTVHLVSGANVIEGSQITATPEPSSFFLAGLGLIASALAARKLAQAASK